MATYSPQAAHLLALCEIGDEEHLLPLLQDAPTLSTILSKEPFTLWPDTNLACTVEHFILERMLIATAENGHVSLLTILLAFSQHLGVAVPHVITQNVLHAALRHITSSLDLLLALQRVQPDVFSMRLPIDHHILQTVCRGSKYQPRARLPLLKHMMEMGFDPNLPEANYRGKKGVLLHMACRYTCYDMVACLLQYGAIIKGSGAQRGAAYMNRVDVLEALLEYRADLDECYEQKDWDGPAGAAIHVAVAKGHVEIVRWLVENGADCGLKNSDGATPGELLSEENGDEIAEILKIGQRKS